MSVIESIQSTITSIQAIQRSNIKRLRSIHRSLLSMQTFNQRASNSQTYYNADDMFPLPAIRAVTGTVSIKIGETPPMFPAEFQVIATLTAEQLQIMLRAYGEDVPDALQEHRLNLMKYIGIDVENIDEQMYNIEQNKQRNDVIIID